MFTGLGSTCVRSPAAYDSQFSPQISDILQTLGVSETDLILMTTRDLNKNLKVKMKVYAALMTMSTFTLLLGKLRF